MFSSRLDAALGYAALRHAGQTRKVTGEPYLTHLVHVARIVARYDYDEDHEIVALLHDVIEDTVDGPQERKTVCTYIEAQFGEEVREAVTTLTEPKRAEDGARLDWTGRKQAYIDQLRAGPMMALRVSAADKIHNLATTLASLDEQGEVLWTRFRGQPRETAWFYRSVLQTLDRRLGDEAIVAELATLVGDLEARVDGGEPPDDRGDSA